MTPRSTVLKLRSVGAAAFKRSLDIVVSLLGLVLLAPVFLGLAIAIQRQDGGAVFYKATRSGKGGKPFKLYKFRTMVANADAIGPGITAGSDPRITPLGNLLRSTKLDELPQLLNVLKGDLSLVGPRPEDPRYVAMYNANQRKVLSVRPGMTSAASLGYHHEQQLLSGQNWERAYIEEVMPAKLAIDLQYLARHTVWSDIGIILRTAGAMFSLGERSRKPLYALIGGLRNRHLFAGDLLILALTPAIALILRTDSESAFGTYWPALLATTLVFMALSCAIFMWGGLYNKYWRYAGVEEVAIIGGLGMLATLVNMLALEWALRPLGLVSDDFPRSLPFITGLLVVPAVGLVRYSVRFLDQAYRGIPYTASSKRTLIVGAGSSGVRILEELRGNHKLSIVPVAFLDDAPEKARARIRGLSVLGKIQDIERVAREVHAKHAIIAIPSASGKVIRQVVELCENAGLETKIVPNTSEMIGRKGQGLPLRDLRIEDLLRREAVSTDLAAVTGMIQGKRVLVTGGGGSIGSEICRQVLACAPRTLIVLGHGENSVFAIYNELKTLQKKLNERLNKASVLVDNHSPGIVVPAQHTEIKLVLADIRHEQHIMDVFQQERPDVVFHAAAHKHVHLMEMNPREAITNNVLGTKNVLNASVAASAERFVMISTDKAVNPTGIMGASKRVAELLVHQAARAHNRPYVAVRFGNVLGSRGSVVLTFQQQIADGGPVTVTDPGMMRYFMTIPEAVQLVLQSATLGVGGEIFMLDMGEPVKILDLARDLIRLSGLEEGRDIDIEFSGVRPGEKLVEELRLQDEIYSQTRHNKIYSLQNPAAVTDDFLNEKISDLTQAAEAGDSETLYAFLRKLIPEFHPLAARHNAPITKPHLTIDSASSTRRDRAKGATSHDDELFTGSFSDRHRTESLAKGASVN